MNCAGEPTIQQDLESYLHGRAISPSPMFNMGPDPACDRGHPRRRSGRRRSGRRSSRRSGRRSAVDVLAPSDCQERFA